MVKLQIDGFDWDAGNRKKCRKHGVSEQEITDIFRGDVAIFPDLTHSTHEQRFHAVGRNPQGRHVFLVFTLRQQGGSTLIRPISARYMHQKELRRYEKDISHPEE
jgi:uncharacterized DUF497 family protein